MSTLYNVRKSHDGPHNASPEIPSTVLKVIGSAVWKNVVRQLETVFSLSLRKSYYEERERCKASKRASVTHEQTLHGQEQNKRKHFNII